MDNETIIVMIRFKGNLGIEDLTGVVDLINITNGLELEVKYPLVTILETIIEEGRQELMMYEFLPQPIISKNSIKFDKSDILFVEPVREGFQKHYNAACEFFYIKKGEYYEKEDVRSEHSEIVRDNDNVISLFDKIKDKDKGPVH